MRTLLKIIERTVGLLDLSKEFGCVCHVCKLMAIFARRSIATNRWWTHMASRRWSIRRVEIHIRETESCPRVRMRSWL